MATCTIIEMANHLTLIAMCFIPYEKWPGCRDKYVLLRLAYLKHYLSRGVAMQVQQGFRVVNEIGLIK